MSNEDYQDRILTCRDCGNEFVFTAGEQAFYASKGLTNAPARCPDCRAARRGGQSSYSSRAPRGEQYDAICASCGRPTTVPFMPREDRAVYCNDCFQEQRAARSRRDDSRSYSSYSSYSGSRGGRDRDRRGGRDRDRRDSW
ncbi:MAG: zinc-ribbon domain containing protein [Ktedonobacteraceae bacterium]|nr:zinc-ribbon domain containing protein [Ktedonobacteraceae bacterium]